MEIKDIISKSGKTRAEICSEVGISPSMLSQIIAGKRSVGPEKVKPLADTLGVLPSDIRPDWAAVFSDAVQQKELREKGAA